MSKLPRCSSISDWVMYFSYIIPVIKKDENYFSSFG